jgi:pimeloyl-[acyl-carrier protein] methyl ester esterase
MTLFVETSGKGPELVLLHGWGMNGAVWRGLVKDWEARYRMTVIELPGHGASGPLDSADPLAWVEACLAVAPPSAHWLGWSLGGQLAIQSALQAPERVLSLGLVATTPCFVQRDDWPLAMAPSTFDGFAAALQDDPSTTLLRFLALQVRGEPQGRETLRRLRGDLAGRPEASVAGLRQGLVWLRDTDLRPALAGLGVPQYWLFGARDTLVPAAVADAVTQIHPGARTGLIDGAAHAPFLSHPDRVSRYLAEAIDAAA